MKVSILVPIYGVEKYIERCAVSLFEQTYQDVEYIFVNDCTKDNSIAILKSVLDRYPARKSQVRIIEHDQNKGLGGARNTAVAAATGEFLMHVDSDDYIDITCVEKCVQKQMDTGADLVSVDILRRGGKVEIFNRIPDYDNPHDLNIAVIKHDVPNNIWGRLIRSSLYEDSCIKVEGGISMSEDLNVLPRLLYNAKITKSVGEVLYIYECDNANSYTANFSEKKAEDIAKTYILLKEYFIDKDIELYNAINYRFYGTFVGQLVNCAKGTNHIEFYKSMRKRLNEFPDDVKSQLSFPLKFGLIIDNYYLFSAFVKFVSFCKTIWH